MSVTGKPFPDDDTIKAADEWLQPERPDSSRDLWNLLDDFRTGKASYELSIKRIKDQTNSALIKELEMRNNRLELLLKNNAEVGTGDLGGFNAGINAVLNDNNDRISQLKGSAE